MKNNHDHQYEIRKGRATQLHRASTDILVDPNVIEQNAAKLQHQPKRKRKTNYIKKILNDDFLMSV